MRIPYARIFKTLIVKTLTLMKDIDGKHCWVVAATPLHILVTTNNCPYCPFTISLPVRIQLFHSPRRFSQKSTFFFQKKSYIWLRLL